MTRHDLSARVRSIVAKQLEITDGAVTEASRFIADLHCDDLDIIDIQFELEGVFDIELTDDAVEDCKTVGGLVAHLAERLGLAEAA